MSFAALQPSRRRGKTLSISRTDITIPRFTTSLINCFRDVARFALVPSAMTMLAVMPHPYVLPHLSMRAPTRSPTPEGLVAEAPIWGPNDAQNGYAYLPVTMHGKAATLVIDLNCDKCDVTVGNDVLTAAGFPALNAPAIDEMTIGKEVHRDIPVTIYAKLGQIASPPNIAPLVGSVGVHFLTTHYDIVYDFPNRRVRLYALPAKPVAAKQAWLPEGFTPADCGPMIDVPLGAGAFTGVAMKIDGRPVTGVLEMGPYIPKMTKAAYTLLELSATSTRVQPSKPGNQDGAFAQVSGVQMMVGTKVFSTWDTEVVEEVGASQALPDHPPVMLMNLSMLRKVMLFNAISSHQVCLVTPQ